MLLIHPPQAKPAEPPAGIPLLASALRRVGHPCAVCDMNLEGLHYLLGSAEPANDTWSRRACKHLDNNLDAVRDIMTYAHPARYGRAVADINRVLEQRGRQHDLQLSLANYQDPALSPLKSEDLIRSAEQFSNNIYYPYFSTRLAQLLHGHDCRHIGFSLNYLSQALCTFAMVGFLKERFPEISIILGGGLVTTWQQNPAWSNPFTGLVDHFVCGPGEHRLLEILGRLAEEASFCPDYSDLVSLPYLAPGFILPYAASTGCFWRKCSFCPETSEQNPYSALTAQTTSGRLKDLAETTRPELIHLVDNAVSPALLHELSVRPPGPAWYGFTRFTEHLTDPVFCRKLKKSGCVMLKLGLESGSQEVLDAMIKGIDLRLAEEALQTLKAAGITTYIYLLFGTPSESLYKARQTLRFVRARHQEIGFLNLAIFNLPVCSPEAATLDISDFYQGDLSIYHDFDHPLGWNRKEIRHFLDNEFKKDPAIRTILQRDPPHFTSNHAPFFSL